MDVFGVEMISIIGMMWREPRERRAVAGSWPGLWSLILARFFSNRDYTWLRSGKLLAV